MPIGKFVDSQMPSPKAKRRRHEQRSLLIYFGALVFLTLPGFAAGPVSVTFSLDFPNSSPEHYSISVQSDGRAHYESTGKISSDSDERDNYAADFTFSDATRTRIFDLTTQAHNFSGKVDSGNKKIAFTGAKKLTYTEGERNTTAAYNYSSNPAVQQLTALFQKVGTTLEFGHRLTYYHRYQKLALDDELKRMEDEAKSGQLTELQAVKPVLEDIYGDSSVMNVVRARAHRLTDLEPLPAAR